MKELPHTRSCFVCGDANLLGMKLRFHDHGDEVRTTFTPLPEHVGFKNLVHGGLLSTVLDEVMAWACAARTRRFAFCAEMKVRFLHPVVPGGALSVVGRLVEDRRGRIFLASAELTDETGTLCASAEGKYIPVKAEAMAPLAEDLVGEWSADQTK
jgi:uncharacterized protein (TIGR00369 family)